MAGDEGGAVLHVETPLDPALEEVARLGQQADGSRPPAATRPAVGGGRVPAADDTAYAAAPPTAIAASSPPAAPDQVLFGETAGASFGPAEQPPGGSRRRCRSPRPPGTGTAR